MTTNQEACYGWQPAQDCRASGQAYAYTNTFYSRNGNQQHGECHLFDLAPETASWSSRPCNQGRCAITYIHPNASTQGPPTSSAVQVNQEEISSRTFSP